MQPHTTGNTEAVTAVRKFRILIVDDNRDTATSMGMMLSLMGNEVRLAHDGSEGSEAAAAFRPDVLLPFVVPRTRKSAVVIGVSAVTPQNV